ncbi:MAG: hypothetical protein ACO1OG_04250 [Devosia sp.]
MNLVPWLLVAMNLVGAGMMARFGLPRDVPLIGRDDADPIWGFVGLALLITSIAIRVALTVTTPVT